MQLLVNVYGSETDYKSHLKQKEIFDGLAAEKKSETANLSEKSKKDK